MPTIVDPKIRRLFRLIGTWVGGDFGPYTIYTTARRKRVFFARQPPPSPPSPAQARCRARFGLAIRNWTLLSPADKRSWERLAIDGGLVATGLDLWIHLSLMPERSGWTTFARRMGTTLTAPDFIPR